MTSRTFSDARASVDGRAGKQAGRPNHLISKIEVTLQPNSTYVVVMGGCRLSKSRFKAWLSRGNEWSAGGISGWSQKGSFIGQRITAAMPPGKR